MKETHFGGFLTKKEGSKDTAVRSLQTLTGDHCSATFLAKRFFFFRTVFDFTMASLFFRILSVLVLAISLSGCTAKS